MDIKEALSQLDTLNDDHWTQSGDVRIEAVAKLVGSAVTRQEIINVAPHFNRTNVDLPGDTSAPEPESKPDVVTLFVDREDLEEEDALNVPLTPEEFSKFIRGRDEEEIREIRDHVEAAMAETQKMIKDLQDIAKTLKIQKVIADKTLNVIAPDYDNQGAIQQHLRRQTEERERRFAEYSTAKAIVKEAGIKLRDPRSLIDQAMARKNNRGKARPTR